ncbi:unnamed protein product [Bursaphelenchus okinawaensis]|uniref:BED-type domain-containing protein n=1 Tax=Bursaphelenchus okinawaensis TaxID=465554 RepID=A0A811LML1_9BILA|nr:unnamed protein product [Bursaphelenchus okinawaensis]CAG9127203.1 unnamed protein product [Bursaphelenchus okinawaensis]
MTQYYALMESIATALGANFQLPGFSALGDTQIKEENGSDSGNDSKAAAGKGGRLRAPRWKDLKEEIDKGALRREPVTGEVAQYIDRIFDANTQVPLYFFCKLCHRVFVHNNSSSSNRRHLRETHGLKISRCFGDGPGNEVSFDLNNTVNEDCNAEDENMFTADSAVLADWTTQTTSGEILNRFLEEAEIHHNLQEKEKEKQKEFEITFNEVVSRISQPATPPPPVVPVVEKKEPKVKEMKPVTAMKNRLVLKPASAIKPQPTIRRRKPRLQLLRERLLAARARKENAIALRTLAEANRIKMETMLAVHRAGFTRIIENGQMVLKKLESAPDFINETDYDVTVDEGNFGEVNDVPEEE